MIGKFRKFFQSSGEQVESSQELNSIQLSVAVLLVEIARADHDHSDIEARNIRQQLVSRFALSDEETGRLINTAEEVVEQSVSLHDHTRTLHSEMSYTEKEAVIEMLWQIALSDQYLDKYEDYMIGKIAELLYVYRGDVMRLKQRAIEAISQTSP